MFGHLTAEDLPDALNQLADHALQVAEDMQEAERLYRHQRAQRIAEAGAVCLLAEAIAIVNRTSARPASAFRHLANAIRHISR